jgi:hypothetical protein
LDFHHDLIRSLGCLLLAPLVALPALAAQPPGPSSPTDGEVHQSADRAGRLYIILDNPAGIDALLEKISHPDMELRRVVPAPKAVGSDAAVGRPALSHGVVESVRVRGRIAEDYAILKVEFAIVLTSDDATWVPIRLDDQKLAGAREGSRELTMRRNGQSQWEVELTGRGRHPVEVDLRAQVTAKPARKALSLAIPLAASTSLDVAFARHESDIIIGTNEVFEPAQLGDGKGTRLTAALTPRSRIDVSWANDTDSGGQVPPLLTAQGEIAIDIGPEQMSTRSSWQIWCVRGMTRTLEFRIDDQDKVTELRLDDQQTETADIEGARGSGRLTIRLGTPLRPDAPPKRLVMRTRRSYSKAAAHRIGFGGFPLLHAREQSGAIGLTQSPNLWISPAMSRGLRRIETGGLPADLRERPSTRLAFEFVDQSFLLQLDVEASPPLVRTLSQTVFRIDANHARSEATIELQWVRGQLFEVELDIGPGLEIVSVGPNDVVAGWSLGGESTARGSAPPARVLKIGLTSLSREQMKASLQLKGYQRIPRDGPVKLGLFAPDATTSIAASYALSADRSLSVELDDDTGQVTRSGDLSSQAKTTSLDRPASSTGGASVAPPLLLSGSGAARSLPIRITRHARSLANQTVLSADVSRRAVDLLQETTLTVRHGTLGSLEIRVPAAIVDRWELLEHEVVDREELARDADGTRHYRLLFDRPVLDKTALRFHWRMSIAPHLDATGPREVAMPWISFPEAATGPVRLELSTAPGILLQGTDPAWIPVIDDGQANPGKSSSTLALPASPVGPGHPFAFKALALDPVKMPSLVVPRLLIRTVQGFDGTIRSRAQYWVEIHGPVLSFTMPDGARWLAARVDGQVTDQVDYDSTRPGYRLRLPAEAGSRPALVELEYQIDGPAAGSRWRVPRLLDGGIVLETLWDVQLPWDRVIVGVPRGWSDENEWYWSGKLWKRRPWKDGTTLDQWVGDAGLAPASDELSAASVDDSHHWLFSRTGPPTDLGVWVLSRAWIVAACSGVTLIFGFLAIFTRIRFRTAWAVVAVLTLLAAALSDPSVTWLGLQSAFMGAALTVLGLLIQRLLDRPKASLAARETSPVGGQVLADSSVEQPAIVGSDDSTAIRVRVPSTMDFIPSPIAGSASEDPVRSSTL